jgi:hypothetical protein
LCVAVQILPTLSILSPLWALLWVRTFYVIEICAAVAEVVVVAFQ